MTKKLIGNVYLGKEKSIPRTTNNMRIGCPRYRSLNFSIQTFWRPFWIWHMFRRSTVLCRCPKMSPTFSCWFRYNKITTCPNLIKIRVALIASCLILINIWAALFGFSTQIPFDLKCSLRVFPLTSPFLLFHFHFSPFFLESRHPLQVFTLVLSPSSGEVILDWIWVYRIWRVLPSILLKIRAYPKKALGIHFPLKSFCVRRIFL